MKLYTKAKIQPLIEKHQRTLTLDDVETIIELDKIAERIEKNAAKVVDRDWFKIGDRFYSKPTFARLDLIDKVNERFTTRLFNLVGILYALDLETTRFDKPPSLARLIAYKRKVTVTLDEINRELERNLEICKDEEVEEVERRDNVWRMCCVLARESGGSPDEWYNATPNKLQAAIDSVEEKYEAEAAAHGKKGPPRETPTILAIKEFREKTLAMEASWLAE